MHFSIERQGQALVASLVGEFDLHSAPKFKQSMAEVFAEYPQLKHLILDVQKVSFIDSSGLGVILGRYREIEEKGGRLFFVRANPQIKRILQLSGFEKISEFANSTEEVLAWIRGQL
ncbi:MAG: anti-sigma factor antagonist [Firmicutes bacterium]|nr:anti-sigma factor antagonist [Bacillota bacterium]NLO65935.1 anti-sigma factor antagonist [Bacillota bacterium]